MNLCYKSKVKQPELTKIEILILSALGEVSNRLEDILKGCRRKYEVEPNEFMEKHVSLMWRATEAYNTLYVKFGYFNRGDLKEYINKYIERMEINEAWESLEDIEATWDEFINTVSIRLKLNETHEDNFIKYYFINTKQLYDHKKQSYIQYEDIFNRLSFVILMPIYVPGSVLHNWMTKLEELEKEFYVLGIDTSIILFGNSKKAKLWMKQYKINYENIFLDTSDEIMKAQRNMSALFSIKSMESVGLSTKQKMQFITPSDVNWEKNLFPGGFAFINKDGTVLNEFLCKYVGQFPSSIDIIDKSLIAFGTFQGLTNVESKEYLKDGMKYYIKPEFSRMRYEVNSGFYYDPISTLYYESKSGYFYDGNRAIYLYWDKEQQCYLPVTSYETADNNTPIDDGVTKQYGISSKPVSYDAELKSTTAIEGQNQSQEKQNKYVSIKDRDLDEPDNKRTRVE